MDNENFIRPTQKALILIYLLLSLAFGLTLLLLTWPNGFADTFISKLSDELRLLIIVAGAGFLGSTLYALMNYTTVIASMLRLNRSWIPWYFTRGLIGLVFALIIYLSLRGFIVTPNIETKYLNAFGLTATSILIGMFSETLFKKLSIAINALLGNKTEIEKKIDNIGKTLGTTILDNYNGFLFTEIYKMNNESNTYSKDNSSDQYELIAWFQAGDIYDKLSTFKSDRLQVHEINITDGNDVEFIEFKIVPKSESINFYPSTINARINASSRSEFYRFSFTAYDKNFGEDCWIEISQKNRLIVASPIRYILT